MKKTIIAASLTALAMGSVFAAETYKYNQAQGEPITTKTQQLKAEN